MHQKKYILGIDQSTQGTKALLFDEKATMIARADVVHKQHINKDGWVSHDLNEIYTNLNEAVKRVVNKAGINKDNIVALGITNQRETTAIWDKSTGQPLNLAVVWQCDRAKDICEKIKNQGYGEKIKEYSGLPLSPFFPASKMRWLLDQHKTIMKNSKEGICLGTIDSWIVFKLTHGVFKTDYSNASRSQLFNINTLQWDEELCEIFDIPMEYLPEVCHSNSYFGETDFDGYLPIKIPIHSVLGDSHAALFGQGCSERGMVKATYGTGSSIMMNIGEQPVVSKHGVVTSLAWSIDGKIDYVLEGNINYAGAIVSWLKNDLELISTPEETEVLAKKANPKDETYLVPAFTGLGAPYWNTDCSAILCGIRRFTGKAEIVRAGLDCIAYQVNDIIEAMKEDAKTAITELRVDGGITGNDYLMQFQSDILDTPVLASHMEELSGIGVAILAGITIGLYPKDIQQQMNYKRYHPIMSNHLREHKKSGWRQAVLSII